MPEVIEVLKYADFLRSKLIGQKITDIRVINGRYKKHGDFEYLDKLKKDLPLSVSHILTKGKFLYFVFSNGMYLFSTLGLSGGWLWEKEGSYQFGHHLKYIDQGRLDNYHKQALNHLNVEFVCKEGSIFYYDVLSFGTMKVVLTEKDVEKKLATIGPDVSLKSTSFDIFKERFVKQDKQIGVVLLNQRVVSGIGNYLRADVLWLCKISPFRSVKELSANELKKIWEYSQMLIWAKYDYKKGVKNGLIKKSHPKLPSDYEREFYVYNENSDPNGHPVKKAELFEGSQKRFIYWAPAVQK